MPTTAPTATPPRPPFQPVAAALAWLVPGAGHLYLGHVRRGLLIGAGIVFLFASGLLIGGISCVDRRENFFWFLGQALAGPVTLGTDYVHQTSFKAYDHLAASSVTSTDALANLKRRSAYPFEVRDSIKPVLRGPAGTAVTVEIPVFRPANTAQGETPAPPYTRSLGRASELGTLFITIAGFMNLICIIDAAWRRRWTPEADRPRSSAAEPAAATGGGAA